MDAAQWFSRRISAVFLVCAQFPTVGSAAASVWLTDHQTLQRLDPATNEIAVTVALADKPAALAADARDGAVWVLAKKRLQRFDAAGQLVQELDLRALAPKLEDPKHLALDPHSGSLWVGAEKTLLHLSAAGEKLLEWQAPGVIRALALDGDDSLWLLTHGALLHLSSSADLLGRIELEAALAAPRHLAVDALGASVWVAGRHGLLRFNALDLYAPPREIALPSTDAPATMSAPDEETDAGHIEALAVHPLLGTLWAATKRTLHLYDRAGHHLRSVDLDAHGLKHIEHLAFEPPSASLWLGTKNALGRLTSDGEWVARIVLDDKIAALAATPFALAPTLTLTEPADRGLTNNAEPEIRLQFGSDCNGAPCVLPPVYYDSLALEAELNGLAIGPLFARTATEASYRPPAPLPEGVNTLFAQAVDLFGHGSTPIEARFTVDTVPPRFLSVTPPDGANLANANLTINGSVDDPTATVLLLDAGGAAIGLGTTAFDFAVVLTPGLNTFTLLARDPAGNESSRPLRLSYGGLSIHIMSPAPDAVLQTHATLVTGTFQGPPNTGISVNGVVAQSFGNRFYASLGLAAGPNPLSATATSPDGATATDSVNVTVNRTTPDPIELSADPASGIAPLTVRFTVRANTAQPLSRLTVDFEGDGTADFTTTDPNALIEHTYAGAGVYHAMLIATDGAGAAHTLTVPIIVRALADMDAMLRGIYTGMLNHLRAGNIDAALSALSGGVRERYQAVFTALGPNLGAAIDRLGTIADGRIGSEFAEYLLVRERNGQRRGFYIYFIRSEDGVWRIDAM